MITAASTLGEIKKIDLCGKTFKYFIYEQSGTGAGNLTDDKTTLDDIQRKNVTWDAYDMAYGLNALIKQKSHRLEYKVYDKDDISADPGKEDVKVFYFRADESARKNKTLILAAGGAYGAVCSMVEAFPVAARFAEMGVDSFCLNYRVGAPEPLFPKPMEDMAAAVRFLTENSGDIGINMNDYAVGGFSAGGHLASCFGLKDVGYACYGLQRPSAVILVYPMTDIWSNVSPVPEPMRSIMLGGYFGENYTKEMADKYNAALLCDKDYPPCFISQAKDDTTVPITLTETFFSVLKSKGVPVEFIKAENGSHGYGLGSSCDAAGWPEKALTFWTEQSERK